MEEVLPVKVANNAANILQKKRACSHTLKVPLQNVFNMSKHVFDTVLIQKSLINTRNFKTNYIYVFLVI